MRAYGLTLSLWTSNVSTSVYGLLFVLGIDIDAASILELMLNNLYDDVGRFEYNFSLLPYTQR